MKELEGHEKLKGQDTIELVQQDQQKKEVKFIGRQIKTPGHILWEYNPKIREVIPASFQKTDYILKEENLRRTPEGVLELLSLDITNKVMVSPGCIYFQALNLRNAKKILKRKYSIEL